MPSALATAPGTVLEASYLGDSPLSALCAPDIANQLTRLADLLKIYAVTLLYRRDEWNAWLQTAGGPALSPAHPVTAFDSSITMIEAAQAGAGIAIAPPRVCSRILLQQQRLVQPFGHEITLGGYWLTRLQSRAKTRPPCRILPIGCWQKCSNSSRSQRILSPLNPNSRHALP